VIIERNVVRADVIIPPFDFIDRLIRENHWDYLYHYSDIVFPRQVHNFYRYLEVVQDEQSNLTMQTTIRGVTFRVDAALIGSFIETDPVPFEGIPFPDFVDPPSLEELIIFYDPQHRAPDRVSHSIRIGIFSSSHRLLAKLVQHNLWLMARRSELVLKRERFLYALIQRIPFCLCKHIVLTILQMRDKHQTSLPFVCLVTKICIQVVPDIPAIEPKEKTKDILGKHTMMKSTAHLRIEDQ
jgi:hypothetical protein